MRSLNKAEQASHTPGPWKDGNEAIKVAADRSKPWNGTVFQEGVDDEARALVAMTFGATVEECTATARLVAAAPCLLSALVEITEASERDNDPAFAHLRIAARAAIAKATEGAA